VNEPRADTRRTHAQPIPGTAKEAWFEILRGRRGVYTLLLNIGILFFGIDTFLVNTLMPTIVADIGGVAFYAWAIMLYLVGAIVGSASYGPLRARIGGRRALAFGGAVFSLGALGCSLAPTIAALLVFRLFQGVGGGMILAGSMAFISALFEPHQRRYAVAVTNATWIVSALLGPLQGGILADLGWWRGAFMLYVPIGTAFLAGVLWRIPEGADKAAADSRLLRFPIWRVALLGLGVLCVASSGQVPNALARVALIAIAAVIVWYAVTRDAAAENRLFPSQPFSPTAPVGLAYWGHMLVSSSYVAVSIYLPLVLTLIYGLAPLYVGFANALMSIGWSVSSGLTAGLHGNRERIAVSLAPLCLLAGCVGLAVTVVSGWHLAWLIAFAMMVGAGIGIFHVHMTVRVMGAAREGEESITASSLSTIRSLGMAFGAALAGTVANIAGLQQVATFTTVQTAVTGVYLFNALPLALALLVAVRFYQIVERAPKPHG
jgi:MFS family permease